jgi:hypothetical protein
VGFVLLCPLTVRADGGTLRLSEKCNDFRISLFTAPTALRAGPVDFSVLVQAADSDVPLLDGSVTVHVYPDGQPHRRQGGLATTAAATNKLFRAIQLELDATGLWHVEVVVHTPDRSARVATELEVGPPLPSWLDLGLWIGWPAVVVLMFGCHQCLVQRRKSIRGGQRCGNMANQR